MESNRTALVIDADHEVVDELSQILKSSEWTILEAGNNVAALELARAIRFDLILTSGKTSGREDVELLRSIRRLHPHTRMIILTDESTPRDVLEAIREGAFSYFSWPFSLEALADTLRNAMEEPCWDDGIEVLSATPTWIRLAARCDTKTADRLIQFVREMIDLPDDEKDTVAWALRELLMNAIEHGAKFDPNQYVEMSYFRTKRAVACRIKDPGKGFSFEEIHHAAVSNPLDDPLRHVGYREAENLRPGGFGILLARNSVDELIYNDTGNEVVLIKYLDSVPTLGR
jgi:anti-sigma regulatory factor (Ser/Thr protein kinase)/ActR/RegA family two-component response regulator